MLNLGLYTRMISFETPVQYYYKKQNLDDTKQVQNIGKYIEENILYNTFEHLANNTQETLGTVSKNTKFYPIDIAYAMSVVYTNEKIQTKYQKTNLTLHEFTFLVKAVLSINKQLEEGSKTKEKVNKKI